MTYYAVIDRGADGTYTATFPDLPGCESTGDTLPLAQEQAAIAAAEWLAQAKEPPEARDRDALLKDSEVSVALATGSLLVAVEPAPTEATK